MNSTENKIDVIQYATSGTCCKMMQVAILDGVIQEAEFMGGCQGNLIGIKKLLKGMTVDDVIERFRGISCGEKPTSCPDQLAICLAQYKSKKEKATVQK